MAERKSERTGARAAHSDPPAGQRPTPEDEQREAHLRASMAPGGGDAGAGAGTVPELLEARVREAQAVVDGLREDAAARLARQMQLTPEEVARVRLHAVDLDNPPILGHKLASHDEHRSDADDGRSGVERVRGAVLEARYPVAVTRAEFEEALQSEGFTDDDRTEARQMAARQEIYIRGR